MGNEFPDGAAMVFGGSGGIGRTVATALARAGTPVALTYRSNEKAANAALEAIEAAGVAGSKHAVDVTDPAEIARAFGEAVDRHGRIHTVVWAAGPLVTQVHLADTDLAEWRRALDVEVSGFFATSQIAIPHFRTHGGGSFVTLGSAGHSRWPHKDGLSVAPKAAIESLVRGIAVEEGSHNIRANSVLVGVIEAGMFKELLEQGVFDEEWIAETRKMLPLVRWGQPEEIAEAVTFFASRRASYVTGQSISVSGGFGL
ncbi:SDR family oxidoreductase [Caenibius sp. WL]|uniref:SDR family NAD(P)-dependent oxidoreductase n=1 Tax=Caenibius sp. WL TaxID=2872646 RepID=UPI001C9922E8|nr:SDR family oxidoreductase [Caenibius sp. WL]QZP07612.1 SDR family oxidoreductase [Caenibius sp. WL]